MRASKTGNWLFMNFNILVSHHLRAHNLMLPTVRHLSMRSYSRSLLKRSLQRIPRHNQAEDENRLERIKEVLGLDRYATIIINDDEFVKCLYPLRNYNINLPDGPSYEIAKLEKLGHTVLRLALSKALLNVFKKSDHDIGNLDFSYGNKMKHLSLAKRSPKALIKGFVSRKFDRLARIPAPESAVPVRIRRIFDYKSFNAIIGYIAIANERQTVFKIVETSVSHPILRRIFDY
ncbi:LAFE_0E08042g1_1 [Lachancea fermentati]|uniref:LAFE_0E08042g1_1 n=1 Tax=Lachancea fermentati TaxID=4955 RepID=A0A1G4MD23_LACFM|nr:LAFE_0E08042g1_1 [Lachancea fermentati]